MAGRKKIKDVGQPRASRPRQIHGGLANDLGIEIASGRLPPGSLLPAEAKFSAEQGISRGMYREAIKILSAKGLVYSRTKSGTRVSDRASWNMLDLDVLAWMFEGEPDEIFVRSIFELREIVEPAAAGLAAERRTTAELAKMGRALDDMARHGLLTEEGRSADNAFHLLILTATHNEPLMTLSSSIAVAVTSTTKFSRAGRSQMRDPMPDHFAVYEALIARDADLARASMTQLVQNAFMDTGLGKKETALPA